MKLPIEADYALRITQTLCAEGKRCDAAYLAEKCGITKQISLKVLRKLLCGGIVKAYSGTGGGYELARNPQDINLKEILEAVGEDIMVSRCVDGSYDCSRMHDKKDFCFFHRLFCDINGMVSDKLAGITLADTVNNK